MIIPTKHEDIHKNSMVLGANVISYLKKYGSENIESLFQSLKQNVGISLDQYGDIVTMLWLGNIITIKEHRIHLK